MAAPVSEIMDGMFFICLPVLHMQQLCVKFFAIAHAGKELDASSTKLGQPISNMFTSQEHCPENLLYF
jgi:hypothetical protein